MLRRINGKNSDRTVVPGARIADAVFPAPFRSGLEYSSPARGTWNIVHTGMLIPDAHEIFVCAAGCLRGVVLTAAEMGTADRFSTVAVRENNLLDGDMEELVIEGVSDIIRKLPVRPPAVLVYTSCVHHFAGCDLGMIYSRLRERFPDIDFTDCYMNPIMRKSGLTPDQLMRSRLYMLLHERERRPDAVAIIGNDLPTLEDSDLMKMLKGAGFKIHEITSCKSYDEYQEMAESSYYISYNADAAPGGDMLADRLGGIHHYLKFSFDYDEIDSEFARLADVLGIPARSDEEIAALRESCDAALADTLALVGDTEISIDYTYCPRPLGLARLLLDHGFNVMRVYVDGIPGADRPDFDYLQEHYPDLMLHPTVHSGMRFAATENKAEDHGKILAIGQKAAYFDSTRNFVNVVEGGGMIGYQAVTHTLELMKDAYLNEKDMRGLVQIKGLGCDVCLR
ncbi:MAG: nitrogenase [Mogibacterium sp.]|nr:nitrogenase [Mogibacterium sp.]MBR2540946.1 nitrogenase [Mogibacterium sp.]